MFLTYRVFSMSVLAVLFVFALSAGAYSADDQEKKPQTLEEKIKENPDDADALNKFFGESFRRILSLSQTDPDAAEKAIDELQKIIDALKPEDAKAKQLLQRAKRIVPAYRQHVELARTPLEEIEKKLKENPGDVRTLSQYLQKVSGSISAIANSKPDTATEQLNAANEFLDNLAEKSEKANVKRIVEQGKRQLANLERSISRAKKLAELVGKDAAPLDVEAWANGQPLTEGDLKGKVVLLDFWAVWCGPCIATFPHLREWYEKYHDKGLVMIGLTRYYNYNWDDATGRASKSKEEVSAEDEQAMLKKFAEEHNLQHPFAIQKDSKLSEYYAVSGIPHVVVIDREGKIRLVRVGSGPQNAKDIGEMLEKLIGEG